MLKIVSDLQFNTQSPRWLKLKSFKTTTRVKTISSAGAKRCIVPNKSIPLRRLLQSRKNKRWLQFWLNNERQSIYRKLQMIYTNKNYNVSPPIPPPLGETYCFCHVRLPVCPSVTLRFRSITKEPFDTESSCFIGWLVTLSRGSLLFLGSRGQRSQGSLM